MHDQGKSLLTYHW